MIDMRTLLVLVALVVGCGDVSPAGSTSGSAGAGGTQEADASGAAGTGGDDGTGQAGTGGAVARTSCNIQEGHVTGTDVMAVWKECASNAAGGTRTSTVTVSVVDGGVFNFFNAAGWVPATFTVWPHSGGTVGEPTTDGLCDLDIRFELPAECPAGTLRPDLLFVHLTVPAI